ncbi:MAG TPA: hypothetical protein VNL98_11085 [Gemmatimonadales bacterium]|nr:hypothetical protein [Gemmatimonadales bacterium]
MDVVVVSARLVHIVCGVFWAGTLMFAPLFLQPSIRDAGPEGGKVLVAMLRRRFFDIMPVVAALTLLSGMWLYWRSSAGLSRAYVHSGSGIAFGLGGIAALVAFAIGVLVLRPATLRAAGLAQSLAQMAAGPEKDAANKELDALRSRMALGGRAVGAFLALSVMGMAVGRYV